MMKLMKRTERTMVLVTVTVLAIDRYFIGWTGYCPRRPYPERRGENFSFKKKT